MMIASSSLRSALFLALSLSTFACAGAPSESEDGESTEGAASDLSAKPVEPGVDKKILWTTTFPTNPSGSPAAATYTDEVAIGGCRYRGVSHNVAGFRQVGIVVDQVPFALKCSTVSALGGAGYLKIRNYPGPSAYARLAVFGSKLGFVDNGSAGPYGGAASTMTVLHVSLVSAPSGAILREGAVGTCAYGPGAQIVPSGTISMAGGDLVTSGTKNGPTNLPGDASCTGGGGGMGSPTFTLTFAGFATGSGPVPAPTFTP